MSSGRTYAGRNLGFGPLTIPLHCQLALLVIYVISYSPSNVHSTIRSLSSPFYAGFVIATVRARYGPVSRQAAFPTGAWVGPYPRKSISMSPTSRGLPEVPSPRFSQVSNVPVVAKAVKRTEQTSKNPLPPFKLPLSPVPFACCVARGRCW
jgi:hypothetical protein